MSQMSTPLNHVQVDSHFLCYFFGKDFDCGIFTFLFMALHSQGLPMNFCQNDIYNCCGGRGVRGRLAYLMWKVNAL